MRPVTPTTAPPTAGTIATGGPGGYYSNLTSNSFGFGVISDGVYGNGTVAGTSASIDLTTTWGVNAAYEHFWNKRWQTSIYGAYLSTSYNSTANANLCVRECGLITAGPGGLGCNNNWQYWDVGTRTQFNVDSQTYIGLDVIYTNLKSATIGAGSATVTGSGTQPTQLRTFGDQSAWIAEFRFHRNFYP